MESLAEPIVARLRSTLSITSTSSALKELLQNSLDAGASRIDCVVDPQSGYLQVSDDGRGMTKESLSMIGTRYGKPVHSSKTEQYNGGTLFL